MLQPSIGVITLLEDSMLDCFTVEATSGGHTMQQSSALEARVRLTPPTRFL